MKVLIVEDNERNLQARARRAVACGVRGGGAGSGEEGVALARRSADVVLMDINLPGMSGVEALAALRAAGVTRARVRR